MTTTSSFEPQIVKLLKSLLQATRLDLSYTVQVNVGGVPEITVEFDGPDTAMLLSKNAELLQAIEHLGAKVLQLEPEQQDLILMEADHFKAKREAALMEAADKAAEQVRRTGEPFKFEPMSSHERRRLHLALSASGLQTESVGVGAQRAVVLHPTQGAKTEDRSIGPLGQQ